MIVSQGKFYTTAKGRTVGPLQQITILGATMFLNDCNFEPGIWTEKGKCQHKETKTGWTYGNLIGEKE